MPFELLIIGISGVTCGGKTTLAANLSKSLPKCKVISQDDYFRHVDDPNHVWIPELSHINFDILSSLDMEKMKDDILQFINGKRLVNLPMQHQHSKRNTDELKNPVREKIENSGLEILIVEGFSIFNFKPLQGLFHLLYYFTLPRDECFKRRSQRVYEPPDCDGYFEECVWPEYQKQLAQVQKEVKDLQFFDGEENDALNQVLQQIESVVSQQHIKY